MNIEDLTEGEPEEEIVPDVVVVQETVVEPAPDIVAILNNIVTDLTALRMEILENRQLDLNRLTDLLQEIKAGMEACEIIEESDGTLVEETKHLANKPLRKWL